MSIEIVKIKIQDIILLDENPRQISDVDLQKLADDIKADPTYLLQRPPLINLVKGKYYCYAGTQRIKASILNGETEIECFVEKDVPKKVQDKRMLVDNLHRGQWDEAKLLDLGFEVSIFTEVQEPLNLTAEMKDAPPTLKITFENLKQLELFETKLKDMIQMNDKFSTIKYSVSAGEM
jgi:ParB-like chromosome segregation protein Spo0J